MLDFAKGGGLIPVIIQDDESDDILMLAYMNEESLRRTQESGQVWFYSRSRRERWQRGDPPDKVRTVPLSLRACDDAAILTRVHLPGPACHTGERSCFHREV